MHVIIPPITHHQRNKKMLHAKVHTATHASDPHTYRFCTSLNYPPLAISRVDRTTSFFYL